MPSIDLLGSLHRRFPFTKGCTTDDDRHPPLRNRLRPPPDTPEPTPRIERCGVLRSTTQKQADDAAVVVSSANPNGGWLVAGGGWRPHPGLPSRLQFGQTSSVPFVFAGFSSAFGEFGGGGETFVYGCDLLGIRSSSFLKTEVWTKTTKRLAVVVAVVLRRVARLPSGAFVRGRVHVTQDHRTEHQTRKRTKENKKRKETNRRVIHVWFVSRAA